MGLPVLAGFAIAPLLMPELRGVADVAKSLVRIAHLVGGRVRRLDNEAAEEMVARMRADAPRDTGTLFNGISWRREGEVIVVEASAVRVTRRGKESADYARFVEFGTRAGERGATAHTVSDVGFFSADQFSDGAHRGTPTSRTRRVYRAHPGTPAQPFFFDNARAVLAARGQDLDEALGEVLQNEGWIA